MFGSCHSKFRPDNWPIYYKVSLCFFAVPQRNHIFTYTLFNNTGPYNSWAPSDRREKRRPLALSVRLPLDRLKQNPILEAFVKICRAAPNTVKNGQLYQVLYT
jgi:hypothetical protein